MKNSKSKGFLLVTSLFMVCSLAACTSPGSSTTSAPTSTSSAEPTSSSGSSSSSAAHEHTYVHSDQVNPTCIATGMKEHYTCSGCSKIFDKDKVETTRASLIIAKDPTAHTRLNHEDRVEPTFATEGHVEGYTCAGCEKHYSDQAGTTEITSWSIAKLTSENYTEGELFYDVAAGAVDNVEVATDLAGYTFTDGDLHAIDWDKFNVGEAKTIYATKTGETSYNLTARKVSKVLKTNDDLVAFGNIITDPENAGLSISGYYVLGNDIVANIDGSEGKKITHANNPSYIGTFDGRGHTVTGYIWNSLFGAVEGATVKNLTLGVGNSLALFTRVHGGNTFDNVTFNASTIKFDAAPAQGYLTITYDEVGNKFKDCTFNYGEYDNPIIAVNYQESTFEGCEVVANKDAKLFSASGHTRPSEGIVYTNLISEMLYYDASVGGHGEIKTSLPDEIQDGYSFAVDTQGTAIDWSSKVAGEPFNVYATKPDADSYILKGVKLNGVISDAAEWNANLSGVENDVVGYYYVDADITTLQTGCGASSGGSDHQSAKKVQVYIDGGNHTISSLDVTSKTGGMFATCGYSTSVVNQYALTIKNLTINNFTNAQYGLLGYQPANRSDDYINFENVKIVVGKSDTNGVLCSNNCSSRCTFKNCVFDYNGMEKTYLYMDTHQVSAKFVNTVFYINKEYDTTDNPHAIAKGNSATERTGYESNITGVTYNFPVGYVHTEYAMTADNFSYDVPFTGEGQSGYQMWTKSFVTETVGGKEVNAVKSCTNDKVPSYGGVKYNFNTPVTVTDDTVYLQFRIFIYVEGEGVESLTKTTLRVYRSDTPKITDTSSTYMPHTISVKFNTWVDVMVPVADYAISGALNGIVLCTVEPGVSSYDASYLYVSDITIANMRACY